MSSNKIKFLSIDGLKHFTNNILSIIEENEYVTATAITDLNDRLLIVENNSGSIITETDITNWGFTKNTGTITGVKANGTSIATSGVANIPAATTSKYGVTKLNSSTNSSSTTEAATASAVKAAYDLANSYKGTVTSIKLNHMTYTPTDGLIKAKVAQMVTLNGTTIIPNTIGAIPLGNLATEDALNNVLTIIEDNEYVTSTAITDLDERLKNHTHKFLIDDESTMPDEFNNMTFEEILEMLYYRIDANSSAITNHITDVDNRFNDHLGSKKHLPEISNATLSNKVLFLQAVKDTSDTNSKPTWAELPVASSSNAGIITTGVQTIAGAKTLTNTLTITPPIDNSGKETYAKFGTNASLEFDWVNSSFTLSSKNLNFTQTDDNKGIYFKGNIYQTKFETKSINSKSTIRIKPGIITKITLNYFEQGSELKLTLDTPITSGTPMQTYGTPYFGKCYITVSQSLSDALTGLITLSAAKIPESIQYSKSSVIEVSITGFVSESTKYYSWRYIYV